MSGVVCLWGTDCHGSDQLISYIVRCSAVVDVEIFGVIVGVCDGVLGFLDVDDDLFDGLGSKYYGHRSGEDG